MKIEVLLFFAQPISCLQSSKVRNNRSHPYSTQNPPLRSPGLATGQEWTFAFALEIAEKAA